jgi:molybdopterin-guanine dinucleotide biosynthesis protein A
LDECAAVILTGGKSSRMGHDKASLLFRGKPLLDVVADVMRAAGMKTIHVSGGVGGIGIVSGGADYVPLPDRLADGGPMVGICSSAVPLHGRYACALFIPVDMPLMSAAVPRMLIEHGRAGAACHFEHHPLPCLLPLDQKTMRQIDAAGQMLARGDRLSVKSFLIGLGADVLAVPAHLEKALTNTNTPEEWREITQ